MDRRAADALILKLATAGGQTVTGRQLMAAGLSRHEVRSRVGGLLTPASHGVFVVGELTPAVRLRVGLAAVPGSVVSHRSAARCHRLAIPATGDEVAELLVPDGRRTRRVIPGLRVRSTRWLPAEDVVAVGALPVTTMARTMCDLAAVVARARLRHLVELVITDGTLTAFELHACASAYCRRGRAGSGVVRALDLELLDTEPLAASVLERRASRLLRRAGLTGFVAQYRPPWYDGVRGIVDLAWPELRLVVELDGRRWHATSQALADDRRRDRAAATNGWLTLRFGWQEVVHRPSSVVEECRTVVEARCRSRAAS